MRITRPLDPRPHATIFVTELEDDELRDAFQEYRDRVLAEKARARCLDFMRNEKLPSDSVPENFMTDCVAGTVDHLVANLAWDVTLDDQLARAVEAVFIPSLYHRYWTDISTMPGDKPDVPDNERRFSMFTTKLRHWMFKYVWNKPGGVKVVDTHW